MWNRKELKLRTKNVMRRSYWVMFAVSLVALVLCGDNFTLTKEVSLNANTPIGHYTYVIPTVEIPTVTGIIATLALIGMVIGMVYTIFIANVIEVGKCRYYVNNTQEKAEFFTLFSGFGSNYFNIVKVMFVRNVKLLLWTLLLIIPGVVKAYEYEMIPYLLAEDPSMSTSDVFSITKQMTCGQKWDMLILDLSFIGWYILGALAFGIGTLFINPYKSGVSAELYLELKQLYYQNI